MIEKIMESSHGLTPGDRISLNEEEDFTEGMVLIVVATPTYEWSQYCCTTVKDNSKYRIAMAWEHMCAANCRAGDLDLLHHP